MKIVSLSDLRANMARHFDQIENDHDELIVTRQNREPMVVMSLADFDVWVEPLEAMFTRVLTQNLSVLLGSDDVVDVSQVRDLPLDYRVTVAVSRFDVGEDGQAVLDARWAVYGRGGGRLIRQDRSLITHPVAEPGDYGEIAAAMSAAVEALSREIGVVIAQARSG